MSTWWSITTPRTRALRSLVGETASLPCHYTPTYASWLNQVERWFGIITQQAIRRGSFKSVRELKDRIDEFVEQYNRNSKPFQWVATADSILGRRIAKVFDDTLADC